MKQIIGTISPAGVVTSGNNFSCQLDNGLYIISFATGFFAHTPVIIATSDTSAQGGAYTGSISVHKPGYTGCQLSVQNLSGNNIEAGINLFVSEAI